VDDFVKLMAATTPLVLGVLALLTKRAGDAAKEAANTADHNAKSAAVNVRHVAEEVARVDRRTTQKLAEIKDGVVEVYEMVDGNLSGVTAELRSARLKIDALEQRLFDTEGRHPTGAPGSGSHPTADNPDG
jgi:hypothetical protein